MIRNLLLALGGVHWWTKPATSRGWLTFLGIIKILEANERPEPLPVCGRELGTKTRKLISDCAEIYAQWGRVEPPQYKKSDIDEIREQLAVITKKLAA